MNIDIFDLMIKGFVGGGVLRLFGIVQSNMDMFKAGGAIIASDIANSQIRLIIASQRGSVDRGSSQVSPILSQSQQNFDNRPTAVFRPFGI